MSTPAPAELTRSQRRVLEAVGPDRVTPDDVAYLLDPNPGNALHHRLAVVRILLRLWKAKLVEHEGQVFWRNP